LFLYSSNGLKVFWRKNLLYWSAYYFSILDLSKKDVGQLSTYCCFFSGIMRGDYLKVTKAI